MKDNIKIPCVNCIVLPICKAKYKENNALVSITCMSFNCSLVANYMYPPRHDPLLVKYSRYAQKRRAKVANYFKHGAIS